MSRTAEPAEEIVPVMLTGGRVTSGFRASLFDAAAREGVSVNEFVLRAAAQRLKARGAQFRGVFRLGDLSDIAA